ncbi:hypothetical protein T07_20 [Trichinella nelsoni]|uniref:Uncharacterized protein n=1 Tax=Trichinella nelsoni TaxID=6336 RepID=A0A0V0RE18_9BILA|nr:hypothetical protein T07_1196 [Trichinella nelsoni]KRX12734.1 hypothetical protein T07_20 [Trichinella nelsoni]
MFLPPVGSTSGEPVSFVWALSGFPGVVSFHPDRVYHQCATFPLMVSYAVRMQPYYLHHLVGPHAATVAVTVVSCYGCFNSTGYTIWAAHNAHNNRIIYRLFVFNTRSTSANIASDASRHFSVFEDIIASSVLLSKTALNDWSVYSNFFSSPRLNVNSGGRFRLRITDRMMSMLAMFLNPLSYNKSAKQ